MQRAYLLERPVRKKRILDFKNHHHTSMGEVWDDIYPDHFFYPMNICWNNLRSDVTRWNCYQYQHSLLLSLWLSLWIYLSFLNLPIHLKGDKNIPWKAVNTSIQLIYGFPKFQKVKNLPCKPRCKRRRKIYLARRSTLPLRFRRIKNLPCKACSKSFRRKKPTLQDGRHSRSVRGPRKRKQPAESTTLLRCQ